MKYRKTIVIFLILLASQLSSCTKDQKIKTHKSDKKTIGVSDTIFERGNSYYNFLKTHNSNLLQRNQLIYFKEEDIDLDGQKEAIVALGEIDNANPDQTAINDIFLLRNEKGTIKKLECSYNKIGYIINDVQLIRLKGAKKSFIYLKLTNGGSSLFGFCLLELSGNQLKNIIQTISASAGGTDELIDSDRDGQFDGFVMRRFNEDALHYDIESYFAFKNNVFKSARMKIDIPEYPDNIKDVLLQYISLRSLDTSYFGSSIEVDKRLKELCSDSDSNLIKWNKEVWSDAYNETYIESDNQIKLDIQENARMATATYFTKDQVEFKFEFELQNLNGRWQITEVKLK